MYKFVNYKMKEKRSNRLYKIDSRILLKILELVDMLGISGGIDSALTSTLSIVERELMC